MQEDTCSERRGSGLVVDLDFGGGFTFCLEILMVLLPWPPKGGNLHLILFGDILSWVNLGFWFPEALWLSSKWRKRLPVSWYVQECPSQCCNQLRLQLVISQEFVTGCWELCSPYTGWTSCMGAWPGSFCSSSQVSCFIPAVVQQRWLIQRSSVQY